MNITTTKDTLRSAVIAIVGAGALNTVIALIAKAIDVPMQVKGFGADVREDIPVFAYFVSTVFASVLGIGLALLMKRFGQTQRKFMIVAGVLAVLTLLSPLFADATTATKVVLEVTHIVAAVIIIPALARLVPSSARN
jgi:peptidoglycan/LPS O-acetylase OafA/YrhL